MKITTNFANPVGRMMPYLAGVFLSLGVVALVVSFALYFSARHAGAEAIELEARLASYRSRQIQQSSDLLPLGKLDELRIRVRQLNELTNINGQTLPLLLSCLEKFIPDGVWLVTLQYQSRENVTKLVAEAHNAGQLTEFMRRLERSGFYSQVLLTRQTQRGGNANAVQFEIQLRGKW